MADQDAIPVCEACWGNMTPGEQASVYTLVLCERSLSQSAAWMQHISNTNSEIAKLKHAVERLTVAVKQPMEEVDSVMGEFQGLVRAIREIIAKEQRRQREGDEWRNGGSGPENLEDET